VAAEPGDRSPLSPRFVTPLQPLQAQLPATHVTEPVNGTEVVRLSLEDLLQRVSQCLRRWYGSAAHEYLTQINDNFRRHGVDGYSLAKLTPADWEALVPFIGPRIMLEEMFRGLVEELPHCDAADAPLTQDWGQRSPPLHRPKPSSMQARKLPPPRPANASAAGLVPARVESQGSPAGDSIEHEVVKVESDEDVQRTPCILRIPPMKKRMREGPDGDQAVKRCRTLQPLGRQIWPPATAADSKKQKKDKQAPHRCYPYTFKPKARQP